VGYRDDREALRQRNEDLEQELARARTEIEKLRGGPPSAIDVAKSEPAPRGGGIVVPAIACVLLVVVGVSVEAGILPVAALGAVLLVALVLGGYTVIAGPHEALVLSGVRRERRDGSSVGYRIVHATRTMRRPVLENVKRMDLGLFVVDVVVPDVALKGGARVELRLGACAKIESTPELLERAVERFLDLGREELVVVVRGAISAATRAVMADTAFDAVLARPDAVVARVREETNAELERVGLGLWTLELFSVEEEVG